MAKLRTFKSIENDNYVVQFLAEDFSQDDKNRLNKFGEPEINIGGDYIGGGAATGNLTTGALTSITVTKSGNNYPAVPAVTFTGDGSGATGTAVLTNGKLTGITVTGGGSLYTYINVVIAVPANHFAIPDSYVKIRSGFPVLQSFDSTAPPFDTNTLTKVNTYKDEIQLRWTEALEDLREQVDSFSGEEIDEV